MKGKNKKDKESKENRDIKDSNKCKDQKCQ